MVETDDLVELIDRNESTAGALVEGAKNALSAPLSAFQGWYDHTAIRGLSDLLGGLLRSFERTSARQADSYMADAMSIISGKRVLPTGVRRTDLGRPGVDNETLFGRVAETYRYGQAQHDQQLKEAIRSGKLLDLSDPMALATDRLNRIVGTNMQMAQRSQMLSTLSTSEKVIGYRRIIHPELSSEGTCGLCIAASDRRYHKATLLPIHPGCHCTVLPITPAFDPHSVNEIDFAKIYADAEGTSAEGLRQTRYRIDEHGEIGPVIRPVGEPLRTKAEIKPTHRQTKPKSVEEKIRTLTKKRDGLVNGRDAIMRRMKTDEIKDGETIVAALDNRVAELDSEIRRLGA